MANQKSEEKAERFTLGPWRAVNDADGDWAIFSSENQLLASTAGRPFVDEEWDAANAHLIAAAPQLYEAVKALLKAYEQLLPGIGKIACQDYANINEAPILAAKALAKAKGEL